jgi:hypothetical protein
MPRAFLFRNFAVYVVCERGVPHHRPHAHIKVGRRRVASVFLETLDVYDASERLPKGLVDRIRDEQEVLVALWIELNEDE